MTSERCSDVRDDLVADLRGELNELAHARVAAHVRRCASCRTARTDLERGLAAARDVQPLTAPELASLAARVKAAAPAARPFGVLGFGAGALALAAAVVVIVGLGARELAVAPGGPMDTRSAKADGAAAVEGAPVEIAVVPVEVPVEVVPVEGAPEAIARTAPTPDVQMLSGPSFAGAVDLEGDRVVVEQKSGFAVFAFRSVTAKGKKRSMEVRTEAGTVQVVGTLFFVDVEAGVTRVGVDRGKVIVRTPRGEHTVGAGQRFALDASGPVPMIASAAEPYLADEEIVAFHDKLEAPHPGPANDRKSANVADRIVEAERLARGGRPEEARARLVAAVRDPAYARSVDLLRYEIARLDGLSLGEIQRARSALRELTSTARASLRVQSTLTLCELDLSVDRCAARACLGRARAKGGNLADEAARLEERWSLADLTCASR